MSEQKVVLLGFVVGESFGYPSEYFVDLLAFTGKAKEVRTRLGDWD
jgi:hypothetical protein